MLQRNLAITKISRGNLTGGDECGCANSNQISKFDLLLFEHKEDFYQFYLVSYLCSIDVIESLIIRVLDYNSNSLKKKIESISRDKGYCDWKIA